MKRHLAIPAFFLFFLFFCLCGPPILLAEMLPAVKVRPGLPPYAVIEEIVRGNQASLDNSIAPAEEAQTPLLVWLAEPDAKTQPTLLVPDPVGKIFEVRTLANQLVLARDAVDYGIGLLHIPVLLITGQTHSDSIRLFMEGYKQQVPSIREALGHLTVPFGALTSGEGEDSETRWLNAVETNVDYQVAQALERYGERIKDGRLTVIGGVLDLHDVYGRGKGQLILININGEKDRKTLLQLPVLGRLDKTMREVSVGRGRTPVGRSIPRADTELRGK